MPTRKKARPHPRSLDALLPVVRVKRCARGHTQTPTWKAHHGCSTCKKLDALRAETEWATQQEAAAERAHWRTVLPRLPAVYEMRTSREGKLVRFSPGPKRRGPRGRRMA